MDKLKCFPKSGLAIFFFIITFMMSADSLSQDWMPNDVSTDEVQIYTAKKGEFSKIRGEIVLQHPIQQILGFIREDSSSSWVENTKHFDAVDINFHESCICHEFKSFGFRRKVLYFAEQEKGKCGNDIQIDFDFKNNPKCSDSYSNLPEGCRIIDEDNTVDDFYGSYRLTPVGEAKTKVLMNIYVDPGFGSDLIGMFKKSQFIKGAPYSVFQTLLNLKKAVKGWSDKHKAAFKCSEDGVLVDVSINQQKADSF